MGPRQIPLSVPQHTLNQRTQVTGTPYALTVPGQGLTGLPLFIPKWPPSSLGQEGTCMGTWGSLNESAVTLPIQVISSCRGGSCPHSPPLVLPVGLAVWAPVGVCSGGAREPLGSRWLPKGTFRGHMSSTGWWAAPLTGSGQRCPQLTFLPGSFGARLEAYCVGTRGVPDPSGLLRPAVQWEDRYGDTQMLCYLAEQWVLDKKKEGMNETEAGRDSWGCDPIQGIRRDWSSEPGRGAGAGGVRSRPATAGRLTEMMRVRCLTSGRPQGLEKMTAIPVVPC